MPLRHLLTYATVYRFNMDGSDKKKIYDTDSAYSGIGLAHLH